MEQNPNNMSDIFKAEMQQKMRQHLDEPGAKLTNRDLNGWEHKLDALCQKRFGRPSVFAGYPNLKVVYFYFEGRHGFQQLLQKGPRDVQPHRMYWCTAFEVKLFEHDLVTQKPPVPIYDVTPKSPEIAVTVRHLMNNPKQMYLAPEPLKV